MEDWRCLNLTRVAAYTRDKCHQLPRVENRVVGQVKDGPCMGCLYSQQVVLVQKTDGTHKSDEPVSKTTWNS